MCLSRWNFLYGVKYSRKQDKCFEKRNFYRICLQIAVYLSACIPSSRSLLINTGGGGGGGLLKTEYDVEYDVGFSVKALFMYV